MQLSFSSWKQDLEDYLSTHSKNYEVSPECDRISDYDLIYADRFKVLASIRTETSTEFLDKIRELYTFDLYTLENQPNSTFQNYHIILRKKFIIEILERAVAIESNSYHKLLLKNWRDQNIRKENVPEVPSENINLPNTLVADISSQTDIKTSPLSFNISSPLSSDASDYDYRSMYDRINIRLEDYVRSDDVNKFVYDSSASEPNSNSQDFAKESKKKSKRRRRRGRWRRRRKKKTGIKIVDGEHTNDMEQFGGLEKIARLQAPEAAHLPLKQYFHKT